MGEDDSSDDDRGESGTGERPAVRNPFGESADGSTEPADGADGGDASVEDGVPFAGLAAETRERRARRDRREQDGPDDGDPFEEMDVSAVEREDLWESLADDDAERAVGAGGEAEPVRGERTADGERVDESDDRPEHVVNKREYCQRCPHLSEPPAVSCEHEGTDIVEAVDSAQFRVRGCPMVAEEGTPSDGNR
ncbi:hypothetical protein [Halorarum halobium]|uniref:hypothetical protein n=1 Tax=Halorarum halobium TaxID=3075121 RepID=UPI0028AD0985|nr:hypothetical protein [Halobaculum sp. XH14]